jgi:flavin reductase (DIM6/NTAB) family NADH-FMN oxidoreductase RutF
MQTFSHAEMESLDFYRMFVSIVVPRPIGWVSTIGHDGIPNLAPYSYFNAVSSRPPMVMISHSDRSGAIKMKDTLRNARDTGEFTLSIVDEHLALAMNETSGEWTYDVDEWARAGIESEPSIDVRPPYVAGTPIAMECKTAQIIPIEGSHATLILGRVLRFHIREGLIRPNGLIDPEQLRPIARLGGDEYTTLGRVFEMKRPKA